MITDPPPTDSAAVPAPREKLDSEFSEEENKLEMADTQAEIILIKGRSQHIFNNLNQTSTAKEIWDNVEMLMQGSGASYQYVESTGLCSSQSTSAPAHSSRPQHLVHQPTAQSPNDLRGWPLLLRFANTLSVSKSIQRKDPGNVGNTGLEAEKNATAPYESTSGTDNNKHVSSQSEIAELRRDEGPNALSRFHANLSISHMATNKASMSTLQNNNSLIIWISEKKFRRGDAHQEEQLTLIAETEIDDNTNFDHQ
ncbi:hypothetical protein Tco_1237749 [Tanacetum coccineum]